MDEEWEAEVERRKSKRRALKRPQPQPDDPLFDLPVGTTGAVLCVVVVIVLLCIGGMWNTWRYVRGETASPASSAARVGAND